MAIKLDSISRGKTYRAPRVLLLGVQKIGKSTLASQAPIPIFLPIKGEEGMDEIDCAKFKPSADYDTLMQCVAALCEEEHDFKTCVIDSASALEPLIWKHTARVNGVESIEDVKKGFGKGYIEALKYWQDLQHALDYLREEKGMSIVLIGHVRVRPFNDPLADPYDQYQFDLQDKAAAMWERWADAILFCNRKVLTRTAAIGTKDKKGDATQTTSHAMDGGQRVIFTDKRPAHPGGCRFQPAIPYELAFSWKAFEDAVAASRAASPTK